MATIKDLELHADPSKALAQLFEMNRLTPDPLPLERFDKQFKRDNPEINFDKVDPGRTIIRDSLAAASLKLTTHEWDKPLAVAFEKSGLDSSNPFHWRQLLQLFCWAHFRARKGPGAPALWTPKRYHRLLQDEDRVRRDHPSFSDADVHRTIVKRFDYKRKTGEPLTSGRIKTALREARNPKCNPDLAANLGTKLQMARSRFEQQGLNWSPEFETKFTRGCIKSYCEEIATAWRRAENPVEY